MPAPKQNEPAAHKAAQPPAQKSDRKPWKKKTPVEVVLDQANKLKEEIEEAEQQLALKRKQLAKFEEARKLFESL